jgi:hypothetical protein
MIYGLVFDTATKYPPPYATEKYVDGVTEGYDHDAPSSVDSIKYGVVLETATILLPDPYVIDCQSDAVTDTGALQVIPSGDVMMAPV